MTELRTQMRSLLMAAVRDPSNRDVYLWCWMALYGVRQTGELRGEG